MCHPSPLAEISHRPPATQILAVSKANLTSLLDIPDTCELLFIQAGGSGQLRCGAESRGRMGKRRWQRRRAEVERKKVEGLVGEWLA